MKDNLNDLRTRIKMRLARLTERQKKVANYILESPERFVLSSVRELENELAVSKATIVRVAQVLGYQGFHEIKSQFIASLRHNLDPMQRYKKFSIKTRRRNEPRNSNYLKMVADEAIKNIHETITMVDERQYRKAIWLLKNANHVYTIGMGISNYLAGIAAYLLNRVAIHADHVEYGEMIFPHRLINISNKNVVLAFSFKPYSPETVQAAAYARERKNKIIAVTDKATSDIVCYSDVSLQVAVESVTFSNSVATVLVLLLAITTQIGWELKIKPLHTFDELNQVLGLLFRESHKSIGR